MLISSDNYELNINELSNIDIVFIDKTTCYMESYPFKWKIFIYNIITNKLITYFRDTSAIIHINNLSIKEIEILFIILKEYLSIKVIVKIIYKKEFIIIHFNELFNINLITNELILNSFKLYTKINNSYLKCKMYLAPNFKFLNNNKIIPFVIEKENKLFLFDDNPMNEYKCFKNIQIIYTFVKKRRGFSDFKSLRMLDSINELIYEVNKIII